MRSRNSPLLLNYWTTTVGHTFDRLRKGQGNNALMIRFVLAAQFQAAAAGTDSIHIIDVVTGKPAPAGAGLDLPILYRSASPPGTRDQTYFDVAVEEFKPGAVITTLTLHELRELEVSGEVLIDCSRGSKSL